MRILLPTYDKSLMNKKIKTKQISVTEWLKAVEISAVSPPPLELCDRPKNDTHPRHVVSLLKIQCWPKQKYHSTCYIRTASICTAYVGQSRTPTVIKPPPLFPACSPLNALYFKDAQCQHWWKKKCRDAGYSKKRLLCVTVLTVTWS